METWLIVGLGNPGAEYADNRHNVGFQVADQLVSRWGQSPAAYRRKLGGDLLSVDWSGCRIHVQKPQEYMNLSGGPLQRVMAFFKVSLDRIVVIHDEIDLPFLSLRVKRGGGHGGHNGLRSISQAIGPDYLRVRVGVGRPAGPVGDHGKVTSHVLGGFSRGEQRDLPDLLDRASAAVESLLLHGLAATMNTFNAGAKPAAARTDKTE